MRTSLCNYLLVLPLNSFIYHNLWIMNKYLCILFVIVLYLQNFPIVLRKVKNSNSVCTWWFHQILHLITDCSMKLKCYNSEKSIILLSRFIFKIGINITKFYFSFCILQLLHFLARKGIISISYFFCFLDDVD